MRKPATRLESLVIGILGILVGALLVSALPAGGAVSDPVLAGEWNQSGNRRTGLGSGALRTMVIRNSNPTGAPLNLIAESGQPPFSTNSSVKVQRLNADLLDGFSSQAFVEKDEVWSISAQMLQDGVALAEILDDDGPGSELDSDTLDGFQARNLIRVAYDSTADASEANGPVATATIGAPSPGLLVMSGVVDTAGDSSETYADGYNCHLQIDGGIVPHTVMHSTVHRVGTNFTNNNDENCATTGVYPVDTGWYDVTLNVAGASHLDFMNASMWVLFVPFDGAGVPPTVP